MFYDLTEEGLGDLTPDEYNKADEEQKIVEIWNDVFMEYEKKDGKIVAKLSKKNVDTGAGFERVCTVIQGKSNVFDTDIFEPIMSIAKTFSKELKNQRIISDHVRAAVFLIADGVKPSNTDQGYILRRIIRRFVFKTDSKKIDLNGITTLVKVISKQFQNTYPNILAQEQNIIAEISQEADKFSKALDQGLKEFEKIAKNDISGDEAFTLFSSYGFPIDLTVELAKIKKINVDLVGYESAFKKHQSLSRAGSEQKFKGGLGGTGEIELRYHTATHLLHQALRDVLGNTVQQKGSNITAERLRFDFVHPVKMTDEQKKKVEEIVNTKIQAKLPVNKVILPKAEAEKTGALHFFGDKYGDEVSVYYIGDSIEDAYSKEFCGGPHVSNTAELGHFKIVKEEAVSAGIRRIKAVLV
jgi:alanyl-tRNA synthetase